MSQRKSITPRRWLFAAVVSFALMLLSFPALAGRVQIRDPGGLFNPADTSALQGEGGEYPFDVRIVATSEYDQRSEFVRYVGAQVNEPDVVVIGVDRAHRFTSVHFGKGLGVPPSQFKTIEQAGNPYFREGNWKAGVEAILKETRQAAHVETGAASAGATHAPRSTAGTTVFSVLVVVLVVGGLIALVGSILSRRARAGQLGPPGYPPGAYPPGGPYPPGYGPGAGYGPGYGGGSGIGGNIASAGLGGLVGYELGKMAGERDSEHHHHDDQSSAGIAGGDDRGNNDAGGSSGGWDDDGGGDWGGDGGGGGDWGGGGGGDGGGGSDW